MKKINIFCFGFGQVAKNFVRKINLENITVDLSVTFREKAQNFFVNDIHYESFQFSKDSFDEKLIENLKSADHILISIPPVNGVDIVIKNFQNFFAKGKIKWITYLSATSVYGDHNGEWVDEKSKTNPTSGNGIDRLNAEQSWMELAASKDLPVQIFRLAGIYSNQSNILVRLKSGEAKIINKKNHFFSRIHVEDIANILFKSLENFKAKEIYNISDDKPASSKELILYGSKLLNIEKLQTVELSSVESEMIKNFYKDSKKVSNKKMKNFFSYELKYPSYIEGLRYIRDHFI